MSFINASSDLVWEITRSQNAFLVKRKSSRGGDVQFSRDPYNLLNIHSRTHAGYINEKAVGVVANENGGVQVIAKKAGFANKPAAGRSTVTYGSNKTSRKTFKAVANQTAKNHYRPDLRHAAVARASALRISQKAPKADPERKLRGNAAKRAAATAENKRWTL
ncbi:ribosomal L28e protein family-domain-containing protein [Bombardia bombarda]|uniref:Ribosomal L28e protein family-domain-containing protein n=1 Tax=Bombardia bombarda TaxID=252184 RepID=A0AA39X9Y5_9PEZI|nr:ribosomal L28e protein family-domain-containing protein [Bombardia bombarda]